MKPVIRLFATCLISPLLLTHAILSRLSDPDRSLEPHSQLLSLLPGKLGSYFRVAFYRRVLQRCDPTATIAFGVLLSKTAARIGRHVYVGPRAMLGLVTIDDDVLIGPAVQIPSGPHLHGTQRLDIPIRDQPGTPIRITIGRDSWLGAGSIILADIAEQTVVAAGSVVTKPHPPRTILAGIPAKVIKQRQDQTPHQPPTSPTASLAPSPPISPSPREGRA